MATNQNQVFASLNQFITLKSKDRADYMEHCQRVMNVVLEVIGRSSDLFKKMSKGFEYSGSYRDNLKVSKPDEYDINLKMKLPLPLIADKVKVGDAPGKPGYVRINIKTFLEEMQTATGMQEAYKELSRLTDGQGYLLQNKWLAWFEGKFSTSFDEIRSTLDDEYNLRCSKSGPAHTIIVESVINPSVKFSIDFVIGIIFDLSKWMAKQKIPPPSKEEDKYWIAIPKPNKSAPGQDNPSWIASYPAQEHNIIHNSNRLKESIRFLKKLRDRQQIQNLKSFYIKNVVMLEITERSATYWNFSIATVLKEMLAAVIKRLDEGKIPSYWNKENNLISGFSVAQIKSMADNLRKILYIWNTSVDKERIMRTILTEDEIRQIQRNSDIAGGLSRLSIGENAASGGFRRSNSPPSTPSTPSPPPSPPLQNAEPNNTTRNIALGVGVVGLATAFLLTLRNNRRD